MGVVLLLSVGMPAVASADARTEYLVRLLRTSSAFRVRAQAAISLGRVEGEPAVTRALSGALEDEHPAVRAAAASSLEQLRDPSALPALRTATRDRDSAVRASASRAVRTLERVARSTPRTQPIPDTTGADGSVTIRLPNGDWWVYARSWVADDPNAEWYWNVPIKSSKVVLDRSTGRRQPRY